MKKAKIMFTAIVACIFLCAAVAFSACGIDYGNNGNMNGNGNSDNKTPAEVVFLVDCSASAASLRGEDAAGELRPMDKYLKEAIDAAAKDDFYKVGIVAFGYGAPMATGLPLRASTHTPSHWVSCGQTRPHTAGRAVCSLSLSAAATGSPLEICQMNAGMSMLTGQPSTHGGFLHWRQREASSRAMSHVKP